MEKLLVKLAPGSITTSFQSGAERMGMCDHRALCSVGADWSHA